MKVNFTENRDTFAIKELIREEEYIKFIAELNGYTVEKMSDEELNKKQKGDK